MRKVEIVIQTETHFFIRYYRSGTTKSMSDARTNEFLRLEIQISKLNAYIIPLNVCNQSGTYDHLI